MKTKYKKLRYIIVKEWIEGRHKGKRWKEMSQHKLTVNRAYKNENESKFRVIEVRDLQDEVSIFNITNN